MAKEKADQFITKDRRIARDLAIRKIQPIEVRGIHLEKTFVYSQDKETIDEILSKEPPKK